MRKALAILTVSTFFGAGIAFVTQVFLAKNLPPAEFGAFASALSLVTIISPVSGFGVGAFWLKAFGQEGRNGLRWLVPSLNFTVISSALAIAIIWGWALIAPHDDLSRNILLALSLSTVAQGMLENASALLQLEEKYFYLSICQIFPHIFRISFLMVWALIFANEITAMHVGGIYFGVALLTVCLGWGVVVHACRKGVALKGDSSYKLRGTPSDKPTKMDVFEQTWPFGVSGIFYLVYFQSSVVLVRYVLGNEMAGQYSIAIMIMAAVYIVPGVLYQKILLPDIHRWAHHDEAKLRVVYRHGNRTMLLSGIVAGVVLYLISPFIILLLFGSNFSGVGNLLSIMAIAVPLRFIATSAGSMLVTGENIKIKIKCMGMVALFSLAVNVFLMKLYGIYGAAWAAVLTEIFLVVVYLYAARKFVFERKSGVNY